MLNITNYWRNANLNYNKVSPHTSQNGHVRSLLCTIYSQNRLKDFETKFVVTNSKIRSLELRHTYYYT